MSNLKTYPPTNVEMMFCETVWVKMAPLTESLRQNDVQAI